MEIEKQVYPEGTITGVKRKSGTAFSFGILAVGEGESNPLSPKNLKAVMKYQSPSQGIYELMAFVLSFSFWVSPRKRAIVNLYAQTKNGFSQSNIWYLRLFKWIWDYLPYVWGSNLEEEVEATFDRILIK